MSCADPGTAARAAQRIRGERSVPGGSGGFAARVRCGRAVKLGRSWACSHRVWAPSALVCERDAGGSRGDQMRPDGPIDRPPTLVYNPVHGSPTTAIKTAGGARTHDRRIMRRCGRRSIALAAQMTRAIALMALAALGLPGAPVHEPVHGRGAYVRSSVTCVTSPRGSGPTSAVNGDAVCRALICVSGVRHLVRLT